MDIHVNFALCAKLILATVAFALLIWLLTEAQKASAAGRSGFFANAPYVLIAITVWLGCFTIVRAVWP